MREASRERAARRLTNHASGATSIVRETDVPTFSQAMEATLSPQSSSASRVNLRLIVLLAVVAAPFLYFVFIIARDMITGGVIDHGTYKEVDLKSMGNFFFDPSKDTLDAVPERFRVLDGKRVLLEGEMFAPNEAADDVRAFELVYNIQKCCFGGPPKVQERVFARVPPSLQGVPNYQFRSPVKVIGTLHVKIRKGIDGVAVALYEMDVERVDPV
jgi:hypothetical protein